MAVEDNSSIAIERLVFHLSICLVVIVMAAFEVSLASPQPPLSEALPLQSSSPSGQNNHKPSSIFGPEIVGTFHSPTSHPKSIILNHNQQSSAQKPSVIINNRKSPSTPPPPSEGFGAIVPMIEAIPEGVDVDNLDDIAIEDDEEEEEESDLEMDAEKKSPPGSIFPPDIPLPPPPTDGLIQCTNESHLWEDQCLIYGESMDEVPKNLSAFHPAKIILEGTGITKLRATSFEPYSESLKEIYVMGAKLLSSIGIGTFRSLPSLQTIYVKQATSLSNLPDGIFNRPSTLKVIRIKQSALESIPSIDSVSHSRDILDIIEMDNNRIHSVSTNNLAVRANEVNLDYNMIVQVEDYAFNGSHIAKLSLKGNRLLTTLGENAFAGLQHLRSLDLSETSITRLPTVGLHDLEILKLVDTYTLTVIPSVFHFSKIKEAHLTYSYHCCAFSFPDTHDQVKEYEQSTEQLRRYCPPSKASTDLGQVNKKNTQRRLHRQSENGETDNGDILDHSKVKNHQEHHTNNLGPKISLSIRQPPNHRLRHRHHKRRSSNRLFDVESEIDDRSTSHSRAFPTARLNDTSRSINVRKGAIYDDERHYVTGRLVNSFTGSTKSPIDILQKEIVNVQNEEELSYTGLRRRNLVSTKRPTPRPQGHEDNDDDDLGHFGGFGPIEGSNNGDNEDRVVTEDPYEEEELSPPPHGHGTQIWSSSNVSTTLDMRKTFSGDRTRILITCGAFAPRKISVICTPEPDAFNPCEDVMGNILLRISVWIVVSAAIVGNLSVMVVLMSSRFKMTVSKFLMCNLAFADFCMGVYLLMIAVVDARTIGVYFNHAIEWQHGYGCQVAGFITVFASELSIYTLTVITLERWYAITYSIQLNRRLRLGLAARVMLSGWVYAVGVASLPLLGVSGYSKTSICLPMDYTTTVDRAYLITLLTINAAAFLVICACYGKMYHSIVSQETRATVNDTTIAKRMALLVFTDFACWAPIAFFGLTAVAGYPLISMTHSKILLVFFYPLNSCSNPYLYAILTKQYRRDFFILTSRYGFCKERALKYKPPSSHGNQHHLNKIAILHHHNRNGGPPLAGGGGGTPLPIASNVSSGEGEHNSRPNSLNANHCRNCDGECQRSQTTSRKITKLKSLVNHHHHHSHANHHPNHVHYHSHHHQSLRGGDPSSSDSAVCDFSHGKCIVYSTVDPVALESSLSGDSCHEIVRIECIHPLEEGAKVAHCVQLDNEGEAIDKTAVGCGCCPTSSSQCQENNGGRPIAIDRKGNKRKSTTKSLFDAIKKSFSSGDDTTTSSGQSGQQDRKCPNVVPSSSDGLRRHVGGKTFQLSSNKNHPPTRLYHTQANGHLDKISNGGPDIVTCSKSTTSFLGGKKAISTTNLSNYHKSHKTCTSFIQRESSSSGEKSSSGSHPHSEPDGPKWQGVKSTSINFTLSMVTNNNNTSSSASAERNSSSTSAPVAEESQL